MKKFLTLAFLLIMLPSLVLAQSGLVQPAIQLDEVGPVPVKDLDLASSELQKALEADPGNRILQAEVAMRRYKDGTGRIYQPIFRAGPSALRNDAFGGFTSSFSSNNQDFQLLTGEKAIDESLQLGSIGRETDNYYFSDGPVDQSVFEKNLKVEDLTAVEIKSHPWDEMLKGKEFEVPAITKVVPNDVFFVYFQNTDKYLEFEKLMQEMLDTLQYDLYGFGTVLSLRSKFLEELGLPKQDLFLENVEEMAFVSDDFDFFPATDYALIFKFKVDIPADLFAASAFKKQIGDYMVVATSEEFLGRIETANQKSENSMYEQKDFHFALANLETRRDGFVYISEAFVRKLTGPDYRLNARRRNTVINALENLQYIVFAYRKITGEWPESFAELASESYIRDNAIYEEEKYSIDKNGVVSHAEWGTLWDVKPVSALEIELINQGEKDLYERFSKEYQSYFREFFDPIGISFTVSDQLLFHTIITPLIDESEYNVFKSAFGSGEVRRLDSIFNNRLGAANIAANFSVRGLLEAIAKEEEQTLEDLEKEIAKEIGLELKEGEHLFEFMGDEVFFGLGQNNSFTINNLANIDIWFGFEVKDEQAAKDFLSKVFAAMGKAGAGRASLGLFSISTTEPLKNTYNNVEYYVIPTGFVNLYYIFMDGKFYGSVSQLAINKLIDQDKGVSMDNFKRGFAFVGDKHHVIANADFTAMKNWAVQNPVEIYIYTEEFKEAKTYLNEALILAKTFPDFDDDLSVVDKYYRFVPEDFKGAKFVLEEGEIQVEGNGKKAQLSEFETALYASSKKGDTRENKIEDFISEEFTVDKVKEKLASFNTASLGMNFIPEGLEVKVAFGNPLAKVKDERFSFNGSAVEEIYNKFNKTTVIIIAVVAGVLVLGLIVWRIRKKKDIGLEV